MGKTIKQLKKVQGSSLVMYTKLHNYHWNITGLQFNPIHEMTEGLYNQFATIYDDAAERVLQLGSKPLVLLKDILDVSVIKEDEKTSFDSKYVLKNILGDFEILLKEFKKLSLVASEEEDGTTVGFADENIGHLEKNIWMLKATLA